MERFLEAVWDTSSVSGRLVTSVILIVLAVLAARAEGDPRAAVDLLERSLDIEVTATGNLRPTNQVDVGSEVSGRIDRVNVDVNDRVSRGQVLAQINTDVIEDQIRQAQANLNSARASVAQAGATLDVDSAQLARLQEVFRLSDGKVPSRTELEAAEAAVKRDRAGVASAQAGVAAAQAQLSSAITNRDRAMIRSPVSGVVLARQVEQPARWHGVRADGVHAVRGHAGEVELDSEMDRHVGR